MHVRCIVRQPNGSGSARAALVQIARWPSVRWFDHGAQPGRLRASLAAPAYWSACRNRHMITINRCARWAVFSPRGGDGVAARPLNEPPEIELLDRESQVARDRWWRFRVDVDAFDLPYDPPLPRALTTWWLYPDPECRRETWVVRDGDGIAGALNLLLFDGQNRHLAWAQLQVRPDARRRGHGRALYAHARERARADGRQTLNVGGPRSDTAAEFAAAMGAEHAQTVLRSVQRFDDVDLTRLARRARRAANAAPRYALVRWAAHCPDNYVDDYVHAHAGMSDAPVADSLDFEPPTMKAELLRAAEDLRERVGIREYVICGRDDMTGEFVGVTQVFVTGSVRANQGDTAVLRQHRGNRLGLRLKVAMMAWLSEVEPSVRELQTWNDPENEHMLRVNHELGYRPSELWDDWSIGVLRVRR